MTKGNYIAMNGSQGLNVTGASYCDCLDKLFFFNRKDLLVSQVSSECTSPGLNVAEVKTNSPDVISSAVVPSNPVSMAFVEMAMASVEFVTGKWSLVWDLLFVDSIIGVCSVITDVTCGTGSVLFPCDDAVDNMA